MANEFENLRIHAARNLGISTVKTGMMQTARFDGSANHWGYLPESDRLRMADEMARIVLANPDAYPSHVQDFAERQKAKMGRQVEETGMLSTAIGLAKTGELQAAAATGLKPFAGFAGGVGTLALAGVVVFFLLQSGALWKR